MSISQNHQLMKDSLQECKNIINDILDHFYFDNKIKHATFTEIIGALNTILLLLGDTYYVDTSEGNITRDDVIIDKIGFAKGERIVGDIHKYNIGDVVLSDTNQVQFINKGFYESGSVYISPQGKEVYPSAITQNIQADQNRVLSTVIVHGDSNLNPTNIRKNTSIFNVTGTLEERLPEQEKSVTPEKNQQIVLPNDGYVLNKVTVAGDSNLKPENIRKGVVIFNVEGTYEGSSGQSSTDSGTTDPGTTDNPTPTVITRSTSYVVPEILTVDAISNNFDTSNPESKYKHGYKEIASNAKYVSAYTRIYNMLANNYKKTTYTLNNGETYQVSLLKMVANEVKVFTESQLASVFDNDMQSVYLDDLQLKYGEVYYLYNIVRCDFPELIAPSSFQCYGYKEQEISTGSNIYIPSCVWIPARTTDDSGNKYGYFNNTQRNTYLSTIETTFKSICKQIWDTYSIPYINNVTFNDRNKEYTESEKIKIAKVIHDYILLHVQYGNFATPMDSINQTMYPAMSNTNTYQHAQGPVCASYAAAFYYCCYRWGISCIYVTGGCNNSRDGRHAWNQINYKPYAPQDSQYSDGSNWQEVDVTWDDGNKDDNKNLYYWLYFNVTTQQINNDTCYLNTIVEGTSYTPTSRKKFATVSSFASITRDGLTQNSDGSFPIEAYKNYYDGISSNNRYKRTDGKYYALSTETGAQDYGGV